MKKTGNAKQKSASQTASSTSHYLESFKGRTLERLVSEICSRQNVSSRNIEIFLKRLGFGSNKVPTLAEIGAQYSLTRERVRQLEEKISAIFLDLDLRKSEILASAVNTVSENLPLSGEGFVQLLKKNNLTTSGICASGFERFLQLTPYKDRFRICEIGQTEIIYSTSQLSPELIWRKARKLVARLGFSQLKNLESELKKGRKPVDRDYLESILQLLGDFHMTESGWFWEVNRNVYRDSFSTNLEKMLSVAPNQTLSFDLVKTGFERKYRHYKHKEVPPFEVISQYLAQNSRFVFLEGNKIKSSSKLDYRRLLTFPERVLAELLLESEAKVLNRVELEDNARKRGVSISSINTFLSFSPIFSRVRTSLWTLRGYSFTQEQINELSKNVPRRSNEMVKGQWVDDKNLTFEFSINSNLVTVLTVAKEFRPYLQGKKFKAIDARNQDCGVIIFGDRGCSWGYGRYGRLYDVGKGNILIVDFDLKEKIARLAHRRKKA